MNKLKSNLELIDFFNKLDGIELRDNQKVALDWLYEKTQAGRKFLILDSPTGSGKSIITQFFVNWYRENINKKATFDMITNTKMLQQQYVDEFAYINNLKGRSNYKCHNYDASCETGRAYSRLKTGKICDECPHAYALEAYVGGMISLTNFHTIGAYLMGKKKEEGALQNRESDVLIIDEAHLFEESMNSFVSVQVNKKLWQRLGTDKFKDFEEFNQLATPHQVSQWMSQTLAPYLNQCFNTHKNALKRIPQKEVEDRLKKMRDITDLLSSIELVGSNINKGTEYVLDKRFYNGDTFIELRPIWTGDLIDKHVFSKYKLVVFMSGTIISPRVFVETNGLDPKQCAYLNMESTFPVANRPIYYRPLGKMTYHQKEHTWQRYLPVLNELLEQYKGKKGIIHTGNYEIFEWLRRDIRSPRFIFANPDAREEALKEHYESPLDTILISPSMTEGVDLYDEMSRFQIILKVPFPSLQSEFTKKRMSDKPLWYTLKTMQSLLQSYGRSVRSKDDFADTVILDECFGDIMGRHGDLIPKDVRQAIQRVTPNGK